MTRIFIICIISLAWLSCNQSPDKLPIANKGISKYRIVYGDKAPAELVTAANAFKDGLNLIIGSQMQSFSDVVGEQPEEILIGESTRLSKYKNSIPYEKLGKEGFFTGIRNKKWIIYGANTKAIINGMYDVLNKLGSGKHNASMTQYSKLPNLTIDSKDIVHIPDFTFRQTINPHAQNEEYRKWNFINIDGQNDWGTWGYSTERIFPSESYFKSNPEYFALINGKANPHQINFSNPAVQAAIEKNLEVWTMTKGRAEYWAVSPYENHIVSQDEATNKTIEETGSAAGALIKLVNAAAEKNKNRTYVAWLDGPYRKPVTNLKPLPNVLIMLDTKDTDHASSLGEGEHNAAFRNDMEGWKKITDNIGVVCHITNEKYFMTPFPNLTGLNKTLKYLKAAGVKKVIFSGISGTGVPMADLKFYVASQLAWNTEQNLDSLIWKYCDNTFGVGNKSMYGYIKALEQAVQGSKAKLSIYDSPAQAFKSWLNPNNINQLYSYFNALTAATQGNSDLKSKIDVERLSLIYSQLDVARAQATNTYGYFMNISALRATLIRQDKSVVKTGEEAFNVKAQEWGVIQGMRDLLDRFVNESNEYGIKTIDTDQTTPLQFKENLNKYLTQKVNTHGGFKKGTITFNSIPDVYFGGSDPTILNDGVSGLPENPRVNWVGLKGGEAELSWDLGVDTLIHSVTIRLLQNTAARAYAPNTITLLTSTDGHSFTEQASKTVSGTNDNTIQTTSFNLGKNKIKALRFKFQSIENCPKDHILAGSPTVVLMDEIILN